MQVSQTRNPSPMPHTVQRPNCGGGGDCLSGDLDRDRQAEAAAEGAVWTCLQKGAKGDERPGMMRGPLEEEDEPTGMVLGAMGGLLEPLVCGKPLELLVTGGDGGGGEGVRGGGGTLPC